VIRLLFQRQLLSHNLILQVPGLISEGMLFSVSDVMQKFCDLVHVQCMNVDMRYNYVQECIVKKFCI